MARVTTVVFMTGAALSSYVILFYKMICEFSPCLIVLLIMADTDWAMWHRSFLSQRLFGTVFFWTRFLRFRVGGRPGVFLMVGGSWLPYWGYLSGSMPLGTRLPGLWGVS